MPKLLRLLLSIFAVLSLGVALAACGDDDDADTDDTTTTAEAADEPTDEGAEEGGPPDENPCAEGASGSLSEEEPEAPADGATPVAVTAVDYGFEGGDELAEQGSYALTLTNNGQELHEAVIVRLAEGETRTLEDLLGSEEEPETTDVAFTFACPGAAAEPVAVEIDEPGRYVMLCFIPVGTLPTTDFSTQSEDAPPHAAQGMVKEFTVS